MTYTYFMIFSNSAWISPESPHKYKTCANATPICVKHDRGVAGWDIRLTNAENNDAIGVSSPVNCFSSSFIHFLKKILSPPFAHDNTTELTADCDFVSKNNSTRSAISHSPAISWRLCVPAVAKNVA